MQIVDKISDLDDRTEQIKDAIDKGLVAKVILVKGENGNIENVEIFIPHATNDEEQGRKILKEIAKKLPISDDTDFGTKINRAYQVQDYFDGETVNIFDVRSSFRWSKYEEKLVKEALEKSEPPMSLSVFLTQVLAAMNDERSGYVCIGSSLPRREGEGVASALQMALLPRIGGFNKLEKIMSGVVSGKEDLGRLIKFAKKYSKRLNQTSHFMDAEITRGKKTLATTAILDTFVSDSDKKMFKVWLSNQSSLISAGGCQASSVNFIDDQAKIPNLRNVIFTTALNLTANEAVAISSFKGEKTISLRYRTQRKMQDKLSEKMKNDPNLHLIPRKDNYLMLTKMVIEDDVKKFRKAVVLLSAALLGKGGSELAEVLKNLNDPSIVGEQNKNLI